MSGKQLYGMHVGIFSYYYLPVVNGVTLTISDWNHSAEKNGWQCTAITYPSVPLYKKMGITIPVFAESSIDKYIHDQKLDILHVHHPFFIGKLALHAKKRLGIPLVFTYHTRYGDYAASYLPRISAGFFRRLVTATNVRFMNSCDAVTVANATLKEELIRSGVRTPVFIVPPGVNTKQMSKGNRISTRKRFGIPESARVLLYVGRFAKEKNIYFLIRVFSKIAKKNSNVRLLLCGDGLERENLRRFGAKNDIDKRIVFATTESPETIHDAYAAADIFIYASQTETYGRVLVEAMAAGLPVVALKGHSIIDLLLDWITGRIVYQKSVRHYADVVLELLQDLKKARLLGNKAQEVARVKYDSVVSWQLLDDVYRSVLK